MNWIKELDAILKPYFKPNEETFFIVSGSYNKGMYAIEMIESIQSQTYKNYVHIIIEMSTDHTKHNIMEYCQVYPVNIGFNANKNIIIFNDSMHDLIQDSGLFPCTFYHNLILTYLRSNGYKGYMASLSDDDLVTPTFLEEHAKTLKINNVSMCNQLRQMEEPNGNFKNTSTNTQNDTIPINQSEQSQVDCLLDFGQVTYRVGCMNKFPIPILNPTMDWKIASHIDGIFMTELNKHFAFVPVQTKECLSIHRSTNESWFHNPLKEKK